MNSSFEIPVYYLSEPLPKPILTAKSNIDKRIQSVKGQINTHQVSDMVEQIMLEAETRLMYEDSKTVIDATCLCLKNLFKTESALCYSNLLNMVSKGKARIAYALHDLKTEDFSGQLKFEQFEKDISNILENTKKKLSELNDNSEKISLIEEVIQKAEDILIAIEVEIAFLSLEDIKQKIEKRIFLLEDEFDLISENESTQLEKIVQEASAHLQNGESALEKYKVVKKARDLLEEVDVEIEKKIAFQEINKKWKEIKETDKKLRESSEFNAEIDSADMIVKDSKEIIESIHKPNSPCGFSPVSQLFVATSGALSSLERKKSSIYLKYGMRRIDKVIEFALLRLKHDGASLKKIKEFVESAEKLKINAEELMRYGYILENKEQRKLRDETSAPPLIPFERVEEIVQKTIKQLQNL